jgi:hypothetical protein
VDSEDVEGFESVSPHAFKQLLHLLGGQRPYLLPDLRWYDRFGGVAQDEAIGDGLLERLVKRDVDVLNGAWRESSLKLFALKAADMRRRHVLELEVAQGRAYVQSDYLFCTARRWSA